MKVVTISDLSFCESCRAIEVRGGRLVPKVSIVAATDARTVADVNANVTKYGVSASVLGASAGASAGAASVGGKAVISIGAEVAVTPS